MKSATNRLRRRFDKIYDTLRDRICLLEYQPGERLSEEVLAEEFDVSRTPLRRVLARLESEELVESRHGVGTFVSDVDIDGLAEVYQLRMGLAALVGQLNPRPPNRRLMQRVREMIERCDEIAGLSEPKRSFARLNLDYFQVLVRIVGNGPLRQISERLFYHSARIWLTMVPDDRYVDEIEIYRREMQEVLEALELGDRESIGYLRRCHISGSFYRLKHYAQCAGGALPGSVEE